MHLKPKPEYVDLDVDFKPLSKHDHLSQQTPEFAAAEPAISAGYEQFRAAPDFPGFRVMTGDADAVIPPGGPDRYREVTTELLQYPPRGGEMIEFKVYKSPNVVPDAPLVYCMHGGGMGALTKLPFSCQPTCKNNAKALGINPENIILAGSNARTSLGPEVEAFLDAYLPNPEPGPRHSPLLVSSLKDLPPALIQCAGLDILRDDAFAYAEALETAGVDVEIYGYKGVPHGFPGYLLDIPETAQFYKRHNAFLKKFTGGS
ncbi:hypothetical protein DL766_007466 [Monosporascus sp. MC13-8B]|uniref:Alpha/beta hydrolase fold-3 domain-containing protein n=1 Tax=Monosporascus cannonballus TaxID=155416 RepID=A0ABY0GTU5_9PEZI|nr:hypothetical protein DL762_009580 [Monosporascus cannonballus]RYO82043.1 hypothetical protein DL763_008375 [Monosporascus cannonballus]RYP23757.1 hypothetical protein DL766_007466 [Monosporascus sp. MC13-8B]